MNFHIPNTPAEELETRITAMLLGELPEAESTELRRIISRDIEMKRLHDRLQQAISLLGEAVHAPDQESAEPIRLASARREQLLQSFKVLRPGGLTPPRKRVVDFRTWGALAAMILGLLAILPMIPGIGRGRWLANATRKAELANPGSDGIAAGSRSAFDETRQTDRLAERESAAPKQEAQLASAAGDIRSNEALGITPSKPEGKASKEDENRLEQSVNRFGAAPIQGVSPSRQLARAGGFDGGVIDGYALEGTKLAVKGSTELKPSVPQLGDTPALGSILKDQPESSPVADLDAGAIGNTVNLAKEPGSYFGDGYYRNDPNQAKQNPLSAQREAYQGTLQDKIKAPALAFNAGSTWMLPAREPEPSLSTINRRGDVSFSFAAPKNQDAEEPMKDSIDKLGRVVESKKEIAQAGDSAHLERNLSTLDSIHDSIETRDLLERHEAAKPKQSSGASVEFTQTLSGVQLLQEDLAKSEGEIALAKSKLDGPREPTQNIGQDINRSKPSAVAPVPRPEITVTDNPFSTFSLNVSDVSFKLAAASLDKGVMPDPATVRSEEFINAFDYRDPEALGSTPIAFAWERARYPFAHDRDLLRLSLKTAAAGRENGRPLNLVLLLDNSGSMERADRVQIIQECTRVLASQLRPEDRISVVTFARTARLWVDALPGSQAGELPERIGNLTPQGGTNLEEAMKVAYQTALRHYLPQGVNRVVLLTDGAANLGDVQPDSLKQMVESNRRQGIAFDCFGIGWEGLNDDLLETLSRNGDGRYGFVNAPEEATAGFAGQLAGALQVAASDVKVQVEFNPSRVTVYRQIGYAKHQLTKEQFRDNSVDAAELGAAEAGNALYIVRVDPTGDGPLATVRVRFKIPGTQSFREHEWPVPYDGLSKPFELASPALRLAGMASAFSEWLVGSPYATEVTADRLLRFLSGVPETWPSDPRPKRLESMIRQANSIQGKRQ